MDDDIVLSHVENGIGWLSLNRPNKRNAINFSLASAVQKKMEEFDTDNSVHVIVIQGSGGSFSAGADMTEALGAEEEGDRRFNPSRDAALRVASSEIPTIASIDGPAYGAGALLASGCDLRVITSQTKFRFPGADYGLVVGAAALTTLVGPVIAKELIFTSRVVEAHEALSIGLVNRVVEENELQLVTTELAESIVNASPLATTWAKRVINTAVTGGDAVGIELQSDLILRGGADHIKRFSDATARVTGRSSNQKA